MVASSATRSQEWLWLPQRMQPELFDNIWIIVSGKGSIYKTISWLDEQKETQWLSCRGFQLVYEATICEESVPYRCN